MAAVLGPLLDNVFSQLHATYLGTNLTAFRVAWKHLVNEDDALSYFDNQLPVVISVDSVKLCVIKLNFGAKSMFFWTKIVTVGDALGVAQ